MLKDFLRLADRILPIGTADAHCDIPCGIYDPRDAIQAAQTVIRMTELIGQLGEPKTIEQFNSFTRYVTTKEEHAEKAKHDVLVLWTDYFKPEHLKKWPQLHEKVWNACKIASYTKQHVDMAKAQELKKELEDIGQIFADSKK